VTENRLRARAEPKEVQIGPRKGVAMLTDGAEDVRRMIALEATLANSAPEAVELRAGYAPAIAAIRRAL
jgi:hypothetical protein